MTKTKRLFYVVAIAIMVALISVACKNKPTAVNDFLVETGEFDTNQMPDPIEPDNPTTEPESKPESTITEDTELLKGKDGVYTDKGNHAYNSNVPNGNGKGYKTYRNYKVTITVSNGALSLSGGPFDDYDYKNLKVYNKVASDGFKALYKGDKEVARVKVDGNTIQVRVSAIVTSLTFTATK